MKPTVRRETVSLNGTHLYCEIRGDGSPVLFISGAFGDGGAWQRVGECLSDEHTAVSYDRRANSRTPAPRGWDSTSLDEQAADAAALINHVGLGATVVWGSSLGGAIALALLTQRPDLVRLAVLHEPFVPALLDDPESATGPLVDATGPHLADDDLRSAAEAMVRLVCGDEIYAGLPRDQLERMLGNAPTLFGVEFAGLTALTIDAPPKVPITITVGAESAPFLTVGARHLAHLFGIPVTTMAGGHVPQATHPDAVAAAVRALTNGSGG
jgi:pimeloyl-ACP methyl ester carboxylesterase